MNVFDARLYRTPVERLARRIGMFVRLFIVCLFVIGCAVNPDSASSPSPRTASLGYSLKDTDTHPERMSEAVFRELNLARSNPVGYAAYIDAIDADAREAIAYLHSAEPVPQLAWSDELTRSAIDHIADTGPRGVLSHEGTDGSRPHDRIERYLHPSDISATGENIQYGALSPRAIVVELIIDRGVPDRGHRTNIFAPNWTHVGIAVGPHAGYDAMCVMDFARFGPPPRPVYTGDLATASREVIREINRARTNPAEYAQTLSALEFRPSDLADAIVFLESTQPRSPIYPSGSLLRMAESYVTGVKNTSAISHPMPLGRRADEYLTGIAVYRLREIVNAGTVSPVEAVAHFIVNPDDAGKAYRNALFDESITHIGAAFGVHDEFGTICVVELARLEQE